MASTSLSHLSRDMPSFSVALTRSSPSGALVEVLSMQDFGHASKRALHLSFQPGDNDPVMKTVDTRFPGSFAYDVEYSVRSPWTSAGVVVNMKDVEREERVSLNNLCHPLIGLIFDTHWRR
jgi:hypothetical protein